MNDTEETYPNVGYPIHLLEALQTATAEVWFEAPFRYAVGGYDVADIKAGIDNALAGRTDTPKHILILLGTNDVAASHGWPIPEETWKTNYRYILDALHTKWSISKIWLCVGFREGYEADMAILSGWMDDLVAEHPTYLAKGMNIGDVLDGHPELLADGLHPNHAGHVAMANLMEPMIIL